MLITYRLARDRVVNREQASIIDMAWRCLYAEIVRARVDGAHVRLQSARMRCIKMLQSRAEAYGRKWELWVIKQLGRKSIKPIPKKHQQYTIVRYRTYGSYTVNPVLKAFQRKWEESGTYAAHSSSPQGWTKEAAVARPPAGGIRSPANVSGTRPMA